MVIRTIQLGLSSTSSTDDWYGNNRQRQLFVTALHRWLSRWSGRQSSSFGRGAVGAQNHQHEESNEREIAKFAQDLLIGCAGTTDEFLRGCLADSDKIVSRRGASEQENGAAGLRGRTKISTTIGLTPRYWRRSSRPVIRWQTHERRAEGAAQPH